MTGRKRKIGLIVDAEGWAFHNIARQLERRLGRRFEFEIISAADIGDIHRVLLLTRDCDLVHFFWRAHLWELLDAPAQEADKRFGIDVRRLFRRFAEECAVTTAIYDHLFLDDGWAQERAASALSAVVTAYGVSSARLRTIYENLPQFQSPSAVLVDGVDLKLFRPSRLERLAQVGTRPLVVGWVGNSNWASDIEDFKGVHTILRPVISKLAAQGVPVELRMADRAVAFLPQEEMPRFYGEIDVYVCVSKIEGTPNPILEAMACGVPVISTDVGVVPEVFGPLQTEFILPERSPEALEIALRRCLAEPELLLRLSQENLQSIQHWNWDVRAEAYGTFFDSAIARHADSKAGEKQDKGLRVTLDSERMPEPAPAIEVGPHVDSSWLRDNLVVCMLFFNKLEQTIESAQTFLAAGVSLNLLDNGSAPDAAERMRRHFADNPRVRIIDAGRNRGVSGGRNVQIAETAEPWLLFVDNDITVDTPDWLERLANAINECQGADMFVPKLFNKHENGWGWMSDFVVDGSGNCAFVATESEFSNAFPGGASLISRRVFERMGGYDEDLFVGFEDFEFAIRAWRRGRPLLARRVDDVVLIHDHRVSTSAADKKTAQVRYDQGHIGKSHEVVQTKHGILLDPNFNAWLQEQVRQLTGDLPSENIVQDSNQPHLLQGETVRPRYCGQSISICVIFDASASNSWAMLRALSIARARAIGSGVQVSIYAVGMDESRRADAARLGLIDASVDGVRLQTLLRADTKEVVCWVGAGAAMLTADFLLQAAQSVNFSPTGDFTVYHPSRLVWASGDGAGLQFERLGPFDPFAVPNSAQHLPVFAANAEVLGSAPIQALCGPGMNLHVLAALGAAGYPSIGLPDCAVVVQANSSEIASAAAQAGAQAAERSATWLHLEQQNLHPVALNLDLAAHDWNAWRTIRVKPYARVSPEVVRLTQELLDQKIANVLILPWLKRGGADRAAIAYLQVLGQKLPGRVLAITTERGESIWAGRIPSGVRLIEWPTVSNWPTEAARRFDLTWMLLRLRPDTVHVMNSHMGWQVLAAEGQRLSAVSRTYASLFWYGPSEKNKLWGYASEFIPKVGNDGSVHAFLTDNASFPQRLQKDYGVEAARFHCVRHPTARIVEEISEEPPPASAPTVLWASRFAPEKRMDLLLEIARQRPDFQFLVFGSEDGSHPELSRVVSDLGGLRNVKLMGAYDDFEALPTAQCHVFLYTSSSDGMPNVVIEAAAHGMAVVASDIGGIGELIDECTGWLVRQPEHVDSYLVALDEAIADVSLRRSKAEQGLARVRQHHSYWAFEQRLVDVPGYIKDCELRINR